MVFAIYDRASGAVKAFVQLSSRDDLTLNFSPETEDFIELGSVPDLNKQWKAEGGKLVQA